ncbi:MAG TPA: glycosyltransferase, partial [Rhizomicrobium sp.]|nr:glycosyltransferase [Rhizomicrobium sp.]
MAIIGNQAFSMTNFRGPLIRRLAATCDVFALAPEYSAELRARVREFGATPIDTPLARTGVNPIEDLRSLIVMTRQLRQLRIDVSLAFAVKPVIYGTIAAWLAGVPRRHAVIEGLGYAFIKDERLSIKRRTLRVLLSALYKFALSLANSVFFLNDDDCNDFERWGFVSPAKTATVGAIGLALEDWPMLPPATSPMT